MADTQTDHVINVAKLVKRVKKGEKRAFQLLYDSTWQPIYYMFLKKTGSEDDARILLNEVYVSVFVGIGKLENEMAFYKWITKIAGSTYVDFMRKKKRISVEELHADAQYYEEEPNEDEEFVPDAALERKEHRQQIVKIIDELPDKQREAIFMYYYMNMKIKEIAEATDSTENTVKQRIHVAKNSLKRKFIEQKEKGVILYNMAGFNVLRKLFSEDMSNYTTNAVRASIWNEISRNAAVEAAQKTAAKIAVKSVVAKFAAGSAAAGIGAVIALTPILTKEPVDTIEIVQTQASPYFEQQPTAPNDYLIKPGEEDISDEPKQTVVSSEPIKSASDAAIASNVVPEQPEILQVIEASEIPTGITQIEQPEQIAEIPPQAVIPQKTPPPSETVISTEPSQPSQSRPVFINVSYSYQINENPQTEELIRDIAVATGNAFSAQESDVEIIHNNFDGFRLGIYQVELEADGTLKITAAISVIDTIAPIINIENRELFYPKGELISLEDIVADSRITITDNSRESIEFDMEGYDKIDFAKAKLYPLVLNAQDSSGNEAMQTIIYVIIE